MNTVLYVLFGCQQKKKPNPSEHMYALNPEMDIKIYITLILHVFILERTREGRERET